MKILIVEDDPVLSELLREYLQRFDHERVAVCHTAQEAFAAMSRESYDCAFIDLKLPDMDGLQVLERIKEEEPTLPIVMMSGYPTLDYAIDGMRKGASDFLTKPFTLQDMALALERVIKERKLLLENLGLKLECRAREQLKVVNRQLQEQIEDQARLFEVSDKIDAIRSSEELYPRIVQLASHLSAASKVGFFILPPDQNNLVLVSDCGCHAASSRQRIFSVDTERFRALMNDDSRPILLEPDDLADDPHLRRWNADGSALSCWPLHIRGELFGFLTTTHNGAGKVFSKSESRLLDFLMKKAAMAVENMALYESMIGNFYGMLKSLVNALEAKDPYTGQHSERVTQYALRIARVMQCATAEIESLQAVGYLHDIGKIGVADKILNKPAGLTEQEFELVKNHPIIGETIVSELGLSPEERAIIRNHHERWDGGGYPDGLVKYEIPLLARIIMVADAFDAMTSKRAYRDARSPAQAIEELRNNSGRQFDPEIVSAFLEIPEEPEEP